MATYQDKLKTLSKRKLREKTLKEIIILTHSEDDVIYGRSDNMEKIEELAKSLINTVNKRV